MNSFVCFLFWSIFSLFLFFSFVWFIYILLLLIFLYFFIISTNTPSAKQQEEAKERLKIALLKIIPLTIDGYISSSGLNPKFSGIAPTVTQCEDYNQEVVLKALPDIE